jgi:hypothetical protein
MHQHPHLGCFTSRIQCLIYPLSLCDHKRGAETHHKAAGKQGMSATVAEHHAVGVVQDTHRCYRCSAFIELVTQRFASKQ